MTLIEVMIASMVATMALIVLLGTLVMAYRVNHSARLRDNARAVLRTYADQFQRLAYADSNNVVRMLFTPTTSPTGLGLRWGELSDQVNYPNAPTVLTVNLGSNTAANMATVTREISYVDMDTGDGSASRVVDAAGFMIKATFRVTYTVNNRSITQQISALRLIDG